MDACGTPERVAAQSEKGSQQPSAVFCQLRYHLQSCWSKRRVRQQGSDSSRGNIHNIMLDKWQNRMGSKAVGRQKPWFGISGADECNYCNGIDTLEHTFFECPTWAPERQQAAKVMRRVTPTTIVANLLENEGNWKAMETRVRKIMGKKESHERSRHRALRIAYGIRPIAFPLK
ncbi:hypothetical protein Trydic_g845 [Trypoxylus dichotomus]